MENLPVPQGSLATYIPEINKFPLLSREEEHDLAVRFRETGNVDAAHKLVTSNLRFVVKVANEYKSYGVRMSDLVQEGNIGLMIAVKKFDPTKGHRLISYAVWWIRAMIQSFILKTWSLVKIGTTQAQRKLFYKLSQTKQKIARFMGNSNELTDESSHLVAESLHVRDRDVVEMDGRLKSRDASLNQPLHEESDTTGLDLLCSSDNQEVVVVENEEKEQIRSGVQKALTVLNDKEKYIVENRLMSDEPLTLQQIGNYYRISRERARQLESRAMKKIRDVIIADPIARESLC